MINRLYKYYLTLTLTLMLAMTAQAQVVDSTGSPTVSDSANFVRASVMIASPDYRRTASSFGHAFLRMECPSVGLDYCFSFQSVYSPSVFSIFTGDYHVRLERMMSDEYMRKYASQRRMITAYPLNLSLSEEQQLWMRLDEIHAMGDYPEHDYFHHGCSQELMNIIEEIVEGRIAYDESRLPYGKTINVLGSSYLPADNPIHLTSLLLSTDGTDRILPPSQRLFMPVSLPEYLKVAEIRSLGKENRPLLDGTVETFFAEEAMPYEEGWPIWSWFLMALVVVALVSGLELMGRCPRWLILTTNIAVFTAYAFVTVWICVVYAVSTLPTTSGWNWHFLVYNPVLLVLAILAMTGVLPEKMRRTLGWLVAAWMVMYMAGMAIMGDILWGYQYLMIGAMAVRSPFPAATRHPASSMRSADSALAGQALGLPSRGSPSSQSARKLAKGKGGKVAERNKITKKQDNI